MAAAETKCSCSLKEDFVSPVCLYLPGMPHVRFFVSGMGPLRMFLVSCGKSSNHIVDTVQVRLWRGRCKGI